MAEIISLLAQFNWANRHINEKDGTEVQLEILALGQFAQQNVFMFSPEEF